MSTLDESAWFSGPVAEATKSVTEKNSILLVYIYDDSEKSNQLNATLNDNNVKNSLKESTVALAMKKDSENAILFGQFYPVQVVPILYFIKHGTIRDFGIETISSQEIIDKIDLLKNAPAIPIQLQEPIIEQQPSIQPQSTSIPPVEPLTQASTSIAVNDSPTISAVSSTETNTPQSSSLAIDHEKEAKEAKKAELQRQLEKVRQERAEREKKEAHEREMKRRQDAKLMQEAKQLQESRENKLYYDKIKKERKADEEHRKKVREQIARDRAEKIAQRQAEKQRQNSASSLTRMSSSNSDESSSKTYTYSHLNIRQLDGSNIRHQFEGTDTLATVRDWIKENRTDAMIAPYKLSSQFPTRVFTDADDQTTLQELKLCPSATIIMKPVKSSGGSSGGQGVTGLLSSFFGLIYAFFVSVFAFINNFMADLFPTTGNPRFDASRSHPSSRDAGQRLGGEGVSSSSADSTSRADPVQKRNPYATRVSTIHDNEEDEDDKKRPTYNGNSVNHE